MNLLQEFFNHRSDANKYLSAEQQEDLENDFNEWLKTSCNEKDRRIAELEKAMERFYEYPNSTQMNYSIAAQLLNKP